MFDVSSALKELFKTYQHFQCFTNAIALDAALKEAKSMTFSETGAKKTKFDAMIRRYTIEVLEWPFWP
jgi:hypothetical protein